MNYITQMSGLFSIGGLVFYAGIQSNKIDELFQKAYAQEKEQKSTYSLIYEIHGKVCGIEQDLKHIQEKLIKK